jgi:hypothetical protein
VAGGAGGQASGHRGIVEELEDATAALDEDPRRPAMRSSSAAAKLNDTRGFAWDCCNLQKGRSERRAKALGGVDGVSTTWMRRRRGGNRRQRSDWPGRNDQAIKGTRRHCVWSVRGARCPAASDRRAWRR